MLWLTYVSEGGLCADQTPRRPALIANDLPGGKTAEKAGTFGCVTDMAEYQNLGDLDSPFAVTAKHAGAQRDRERLRGAIRCDVAPLTFEAYQAVAPCPGCGRPYHDAEPWDFRGTINMSPEERARYDAEEERYAATHGTCGSHRHSVSGSLTMHCGRCVRRRHCLRPRSGAFGGSSGGRRRRTS